MNDNKLIAEFMSIKYDADDETFHTNEGWKGVDYLMYHSSWDWLMPVVGKITRDEKYWENDYREHLMDIVPYARLEEVYDTVVEFIKTYNNG